MGFFAPSQQYLLDTLCMKLNFKTTKDLKEIQQLKEKIEVIQLLNQLQDTELDITTLDRVDGNIKVSIENHNLKLIKTL